jgi:hypothetical protein
LQRSGSRLGEQEYRLRFDVARLVLRRVQDGHEQELGSAATHLASDRWHHMGIYSVGGWKRLTLDYREVLKIEESRQLPAGHPVFSSHGPDEVAYADVRLTPWTRDEALRVWGILQKVVLKGPLPGIRLEAHPLPPQIVPLNVAVFKYVQAGPNQYEKHRTRINPGDVPPFFVHTWILDLKDIEKFRFFFQYPDDFKLHPEDRITVYGLDGLKQHPPKPLAVFTVASLDPIVDLPGAGRQA